MWWIFTLSCFVLFIVLLFTGYKRLLQWFWSCGPIGKVWFVLFGPGAWIFAAGCVVTSCLATFDKLPASQYHDYVGDYLKENPNIDVSKVPPLDANGDSTEARRDWGRRYMQAQRGYYDNFWQRRLGAVRQREHRRLLPFDGDKQMEQTIEGLKPDAKTVAIKRAVEQYRDWSQRKCPACRGQGTDHVHWELPECPLPTLRDLGM